MKLIRLTTLEQRYLFVFMISPLIGGLGLELSRQFFSSFLVISQFDISLFILAASIRPLHHLISDQHHELDNLQVRFLGKC